MSFIFLSYLPIILALFLLLCIFNIKMETAFFNWIKDHWFFERSFKNRLSTYFYLAGLFLLLLALLDLRGPQEQVEAISQSQKTIILIDSSASMLAEDIRPNRFSKAILLARHFTKFAVGHEISVIVFSDNAKRIVPFTKDIDLIDSRLSGLEGLNLTKGGTGLSLALQESLQFLKGDGSSAKGNILIFTDGEETNGHIDVNISKEVSVGMVGIGTLKGGTIPLRSSAGIFMGNKKHKGQDVISKLNEKYFKELSGKIPNSKYWIASSYSLPTTSLLSFFNKNYELQKTNDNYKIRPVLANRLLIPGVLLLCLSFILKMFKKYLPLAILFIFLNINGILFAQDHSGTQEEQGPQKTEMILKLEELLKKNKLDLNGKRKLAHELMKNKFFKEAQTLYDEYLPDRVDKNNMYEKFNQATSMLENKNIKDGIQINKEIYDLIKNPKNEDEEKLLEIVKKNILKVLMSSQSQSSESDKDNKDKQDSSDKDKEKKDNKDKSSGKKNDKNDKKNKNDKNEDKEQKDKDEQNKQDKSKPDQDELKNQKNNSKDKKDKIEKQKMPAILKQLRSDDSQLQKKLIDADTVERKPNDMKDW